MGDVAKVPVVPAICLLVVRGWVAARGAQQSVIAGVGRCGWVTSLPVVPAICLLAVRMGRCPWCQQSVCCAAVGRVARWLHPVEEDIFQLYTPEPRLGGRQSIFKRKKVYFHGAVP